jgi:hypothetical protein
LPGGGGGTAPANTVLPLISGTTAVGSTLTTTTGTWTGSPTITYAYQWLRGGTPIGGANASSYPLVSGDAGATITVAVTASNSAGSAGATSAGVGPITVPNTAWNPADLANVTLSGGNLIATASAAGGARAVSSKTSGKYYWEITVNTWANGSTGCGIALASASLPGISTSGVAGGILFRDGSVYINGGSVGATGIGGRTSGDVIGIALDFANQRVWFRPNNTAWNGGSGDPATNTGGYNTSALSGALFPLACFNIASDKQTANFGSSALSGTVPSGFTSGWPA